jgi:FMN hydrolase / 5-amino-6-(5-phospho-D-ribitylamino)uracil phosphatase
MTAPTVLSFDLDDTLWPIAPVMIAAETAMWNWLKDKHPEVMSAHSLETVRAIRARVGLKHPDRAHDMTFLRHRAIMELFGAAPDAKAHADEAFEVFFAARNRIALYDDVAPALKRLAGSYRLFALSNGNADLRRCGLDHVFEGHITAISAGYPKPDARIFESLARLARVPAAQVVHVGDDPHTDVFGATQAGMQAVWINRDAKLWPATITPPTRTIVTLAEIS